MDLTTTSAALNPIVARVEGEMTTFQSDMKVMSGDFREFRGEVRTTFLGLRLVVTLLAATLLTTTIGFF